MRGSTPAGPGRLKRPRPGPARDPGPATESALALAVPLQCGCGDHETEAPGRGANRSSRSGVRSGPPRVGRACIRSATPAA
ncbi:hypothetical protein E6W17_41295 [Streptomyces sp. A1547]|nr:hypothetical protein E6W17_41295 [Streptomyces sp. A1547]